MADQELANVLEDEHFSSMLRGKEGIRKTKPRMRKPRNVKSSKRKRAAEGSDYHTGECKMVESNIVESVTPSKVPSKVPLEVPLEVPCVEMTKSLGNDDENDDDDCGETTDVFVPDLLDFNLEFTQEGELRCALCERVAAGKFAQLCMFHERVSPSEWMNE